MSTKLICGHLMLVKIWRLEILYSGYGIVFDARGSFSLSHDSSFGKKRSNIWCGYEFICAC